MEKNKQLKGVCVDYTYEGLGIVKVDGFPFFIKNVIVDEEIEFIVTKMSKTYGYGKCIRIVTPSKHRAEPFCEHYGKCGGCQIQHMSKEEQLRFKHNLVQNNMKHIGKTNAPVLDVVGCEQTQAYRNKAQFPILIQEGEVTLGFYRIHSNDIIDMEYCPIQCKPINDIMKTTKRLLQEGNFKNSFRHLLIKYGFHTNEAMVVFITKKKIVEGLPKLVESLQQAHPEIKSIMQNINKRTDNVILGDEDVVLYGEDHIYDYLHDLKFSISTKSFYQVNPIQTIQLYEKALSFAQITKEDTVIDLYCGVGTISLFLAKQAKHVIGIEIVEAAIENAKRNAEANAIQNVSFVCSDAKHYATKLVEEKKTVDVVMIDPPRKGCDQTTLMSIVEMNPKRIVYVSCNCATLARDVKILEEHGYKCDMVQPVDMFPSSYHVESVCLMTRTSK